MAAQREPSERPTAMFRGCATCGAPDGLYLPPWARAADVIWDTYLAAERSHRVGTAYCTFCKTPASYAAPIGPSGPGLSL